VFYTCDFWSVSLVERQRSSELIFWQELQHPLLIWCGSWNWFLQRLLIGQLELVKWESCSFRELFPPACSVCAGLNLLVACVCWCEYRVLVREQLLLLNLLAVNSDLAVCVLSKSTGSFCFGLVFASILTQFS
jgi:hypothetical protein